MDATTSNLKTTLIALLGLGSGSGTAISPDFILQVIGAIIGCISVILLILNFIETKKHNRSVKRANQIAQEANDIALRHKKRK